jgi:1-deoxy-D-xylulose-5-phosphate reductoisomerase
VVRQHPDLFQVELLTARTRWEELCKQAIEFDANAVVICSEENYPKVKDALSGTDTKVFLGMDSICSLVQGDNIDMVLTALVGFSGLRPTISAIRARKPIALANKETLVAGGTVVMEMARKMGVPILPVDSEHSAIFQCLLAANGNPLKRIHLTASGGPFRTWKKEDMAKATAKEALRHPQWDMGAKITIDSATMMNKGFEVIEARWLFGVKPEQIEVLVHPQSIVHSAVQFCDGAVKAQLGVPDMRLPIQYALTYPDRMSLSGERIDLFGLGQLTFERPDRDKFPCLELAFEALRRGGNAACVMNRANEVMNLAFRQGRIGYNDIFRNIKRTMDRVPFEAAPTFETYIATDAEAQRVAEDLI